MRKVWMLIAFCWLFSLWLLVELIRGLHSYG